MQEGLATVEAYTENKGVVGELKVLVYPKKTIKAGMNIVQIKGCPPPLLLTNRQFNVGKLTAAINQILDQAAIMVQAKQLRRFVAGKAIDVGTPRSDCKLDISIDLPQIHAVAVDPAVDVNIYFVSSIYFPPPFDLDKDLVGFSGRYHPLAMPVILIMGSDDQILSYPGNIAKDTALLLAHELGHDQGLPHCDDPDRSVDNLCAGNGTEMLMHSDSSGVILDAPEWNCIQLPEVNKPCYTP